MIRSITVTNYLGDSLKLDLARPELSGFAVKSITGLGPGKATINTTEVSTNDGGLFNSSRLPARNIVISLEYLWKDSIEDTRHLSYKYFPIKKPLKLLIETDNRQAEIEGYVESNEPNIFSANETTDISIICPNPFFYSTAKSRTLSFGVEPAFEFPFCNDSESIPLLEMGRIQNYTEHTIMYEGDAEIGITLTIHALFEATNITIRNVESRETMRINTDKLAAFTGSGIKPGDDIIICTVTGSKSVTLQREGKSTNILNCLEKNSDWFKLVKGENNFVCSAETGGNGLQFAIENHVVYEGM